MANPHPFPAVKPSSRSYRPGTYPSTDFESLDGTKTHLRFGNKPVNATLTLGFSNITDDDAALILGNYYDVNSAWDYVTFKRGYATAGIEDTSLTSKTLTRQLSEQDEIYGGKWRYSAPPQVTSSGKGVSNVSCSFVACLDSP
tara:strand:+ start:3205 stop:3633 length:429 start_codon:yes stop_codon:yes gene_type:complete